MKFSGIFQQWKNFSREFSRKVMYSRIDVRIFGNIGEFQILVRCVDIDLQNYNVRVVVEFSDYFIL